MKLTKFLDIIKLVAPVILASVPKGDKIAPLVPVIANGIAEAEQIKGASGAEKKAHVLSIVDAGVTSVNATGKLHLDPSEVHEIGMPDRTAAMITILRSGARSRYRM